MIHHLKAFITFIFLFYGCISFQLRMQSVSLIPGNNFNSFPFRNDILQNRRALVTGGASGIGAAISVALVRAGASVAVISRNESNYKKLLREDEAFRTADTAFFAADLSSVEEAEKAAKSAVDWAGGYIDILINNAGFVIADSLLSFNCDDWDKVMAVNARAPFIMAKECAPGMIQKRSGKIINISSQASIVGLELHGAYCASKSALDSLGRVMTAEWSKYNIQVNSLCPTVVLTEMGKTVWSGEAGSSFLKKIPLGRFGEPQEIANMVIYLCCDCSNIICGENILMDGGYVGGSR